MFDGSREKAGLEAHPEFKTSNLEGCWVVSAAKINPVDAIATTDEKHLCEIPAQTNAYIV